MTATVTPPPGAPGLLRIDPHIRLEDYRLALGHYVRQIGKCIDAIIFVENSNADIAVLRQLVAEAGCGEKVEFLVYDGMDHPPTYGRCTSESRLLDHAMSHSLMVAAAMPDDLFWKVTGRYRLMNLASMITSRPPQLAFYCDLRNFRSPWADMRLMAWTRLGHARVFRGIGDHIREDLHDGRPGEETLYRRLSRFAGLPGVVLCLRREPMFDGVRAFDNQNWSKGRQNFIFWLRQLQRILFGAVRI